MLPEIKTRSDLKVSMEFERFVFQRFSMLETYIIIMMLVIKSNYIILKHNIMLSACEIILVVICIKIKKFAVMVSPPNTIFFAVSQANLRIVFKLNIETK